MSDRKPTPAGIGAELTPEYLIEQADACMDAASAAAAEGDDEHVNDLLARAGRLRRQADVLRIALNSIFLTERRRERERRFGIAGDTP